MNLVEAFLGGKINAMVSDGRRVIVLGGKLSPGTEVAEAEFIHVLDTSMSFLFVISFTRPSL